MVGGRGRWLLLLGGLGEGAVGCEVAVEVERLCGHWWVLCLLLRVCSGVLRTKLDLLVARWGNCC